VALSRHSAIHGRLRLKHSNFNRKLEQGSVHAQGTRKFDLKALTPSARRPLGVGSDMADHFKFSSAVFCLGEVAQPLGLFLLL
jgi:hypothetical protein